MYYNENNNSGLQSFYFNTSDKQLLESLSEAQRILVIKYIKDITKYRANSLSGMGMYTLEGCIYDINTGEMTYNIHSMIGDGTISVDGVKLKEMLGSVGEIIKSYGHEALMEIKYCCYINSIGAYNEYVSEQYDMIHNVFNVLIINNQLDELVAEFAKHKLVLPRFLKNYFNTTLKEQYRRTVYEKAICNILNKNEMSDSDKYGYYNNNCVFIEEMREKIMTEFDSTKRLELASRLIAFTELFVGLTNYGKNDLMMMAKASRHEVYWVHAKNGDRLATKNEKKRLVNGIFKKEVLFLPKDKRELLLYFVWACTNDFKLIKPFTMWDSNITVTSEVAWIKLNEAIKYLMSSQFLKVDVLELKKGLIETKYLSKADDEIIDNSLDNKLQVVYNKYKDRSDSYSKLITDIAKRAMKYKAVLSEKQVAIILKAYETAISTSDEEYNKFDTDLLLKMNELMDFFSYKKTDFEYKFMTDIIKKRRCSIKQRDLILQWYDSLIEKKNSMLEVDEIGADDDYTDIEVMNDRLKDREALEGMDDFEIPDLDTVESSEVKIKKYDKSDIEDIMPEELIPDMAGGLVWTD